MEKSLAARMEIVNADDAATDFEVIAVERTCLNRSKLNESLESGSISSSFRQKTLEILLDVMLVYKISLSQGMSFKIWEISTGIVDQILSIVKLEKEKFPLISATSLLIAYKV